MSYFYILCKNRKIHHYGLYYIRGGGKRAFQKYESGDVLPSRAISNLLRLLSNNLALLKTLPAVEYKGSIEYDEKK